MRITLALLALGVIARAATADSLFPKCEYTADKQKCVEYPFLLGGSACLCPVDNWFARWSCCVTQPLLEADDAAINSTVIDCWCATNPTTTGWILIALLSGLTLLQLVAYQIVDAINIFRETRGLRRAHSSSSANDELQGAAAAAGSNDELDEEGSLSASTRWRRRAKWHSGDDAERGSGARRSGKHDSKVTFAETDLGSS